MDHSEQHHAHRNEPSLDAAQLQGAHLAQPVTEAGEMPAWLNNPPAAPSAGQRWGRRVMFLGASLLSIAVAAGATMLALDLYESNSSMEVVAANSPAGVATAPAAATGALPFVEKRTSSLPPMVLLPQDPNAAAKKAAAIAAAPEAIAQAPKPAPAPAPAPVPEITPAPEKAAAAPQVVANKVDKPALPVAAVKPVKVAAQPAKKAMAKPSPAMVAKKAAIQARRIANPVQTKGPPRVRPIKGTMLQPPRDRGLDPALQDPPRQAIDRRCRPGELARECEARTR